MRRLGTSGVCGTAARLVATARGLGPSLLVLVLAGAHLLGCVRSSREPLLTYFGGTHGLSVRYPASWQTDEAEQDGMWYRYFLGPASGPARKAEVSVTLLAGPLAVPVEQYAATYLAENKLTAQSPEERQGARGASYAFVSADGNMRYSLVLLAEGGQVYGLYSQGEARSFAAHAATVVEMEKSLTLERPAAYRPVRDSAFGFSLRVPPTWKDTRRFSGAGTLLLQFTSPPMAVDKGGQTVHGSLTLTVEPLAQDGLQPFYDATRAKLGDAFQVLSHADWPADGLVDVMRSETPVSTSRVKRFYRVLGRRGYSLAFEARDDVYPRVSRWFDLIASTFQTGTAVEP
jgi:hypothetical protein